MAIILFLLPYILNQITLQKELKPKKFREIYINIFFKDTANNFNRLKCEQIRTNLQLIDANYISELYSECMKTLTRADYIVSDLINNDVFFKSQLHVYTQTSHRDDMGTVLGRMNYGQNFDIQPNKKKESARTDGNFYTKVTTIVRCYGYAGYGCATEFPHSAKFKLNHASQKIECVTAADCGDDKCPNSFCNNKGNCYIRSYTFEKYCVCNPGVFGTKCTFEASVYKLTEEILLFSPLDEIEDSKKTGINCRNCKANECVYYENFEVCNTIAPSMTELGVDKNSQEICGKAICLLHKKDKKLYYLKSVGTQKPKPNAQDNNQKDPGK